MKLGEIYPCNKSIIIIRVSFMIINFQNEVRVAGELTAIASTLNTPSLPLDVIKSMEDRLNALSTSITKDERVEFKDKFISLYGKCHRAEMQSNEDKAFSSVSKIDDIGKTISEFRETATLSQEKIQTMMMTKGTLNTMTAQDYESAQKYYDMAISLKFGDVGGFSELYNKLSLNDRTELDRHISLCGGNLGDMDKTINNVLRALIGCAEGGPYPQDRELHLVLEDLVRYG